jgi:hypothetical protein
LRWARSPTRQRRPTMVTDAPYSGSMCAQCMATAATAGAAATGVRCWLAARSPAWLTPLRLKRVTAALIAVAIAVTAVGSSAG